MISRQKRKYLMWSALALFLANGLLSVSSYLMHSDTVDPVAQEDEAQYAQIGLMQEKSGSGRKTSAGKHEGSAGHEVSGEHQLVKDHDVQQAALHDDRKQIVAEAAHEMSEAPVIRSKAPVEEKFVCYEVGPFESSGKSKAIRTSLKKSGLSVALEFRTKQTELGHWVYLPPERSLALGRLKEEELKSKGLKDVMLVSKSEPKYAISLGVFHQKDIAEQRLAQLQSMGYDAKMEIRQQSDNEAWVTVKAKESEDLPPNEWLALLEGLEKVELKTVDCK